MNLPVVDDRIEVLLLLVLTVLHRNLSSPIPLPGNASVDPIWNLGDVLVLPLLSNELIDTILPLNPYLRTLRGGFCRW
jgi:hypothetical protein